MEVNGTAKLQRTDVKSRLFVKVVVMWQSSEVAKVQRGGQQ